MQARPQSFPARRFGGAAPALLLLVLCGCALVDQSPGEPGPLAPDALPPQEYVDWYIDTENLDANHEREISRPSAASTIMFSS